MSNPTGLSSSRERLFSSPEQDTIPLRSSSDSTSSTPPPSPVNEWHSPLAPPTDFGEFAGAASSAAPNAAGTLNEPGSTAPASTTGSQNVELCKRVAQIPLNVLQVEHHWLRTGNVEGGMGPTGEGIPGHGETSYPGMPVSVLDHHGEVGHCEVVQNEDVACVEHELTIGRDLGRWLPWNQCQSFAAEVLDHCYLPSATERPIDMTEVDAGAAAPRVSP